MCVYVCVCQGGKAPLHFSVEEDHLALTTLLLDRRADVNVKDEVRDTHTHMAHARTHTHAHTCTHTHSASYFFRRTHTV